MINMFLFAMDTLDNESDRDFLLKVYKKYHRLVYSISLEIVQNADDAEDLTQDVFVKLIPKVSDLREKEDRRLIAYIVSTAKNTAFEYLTHKGVISKHSIDDPEGFILENLDTDFSLEDRIIHQEQMQAMIRIWPLLTDRDRYLLRARYILHKSDSEICAGINVKQDSVRTLVLRARKAAIDLIQEQGVELI